eukprot:7375968-Prymnesium_polylepis.1
MVCTRSPRGSPLSQEAQTKWATARKSWCTAPKSSQVKSSQVKSSQVKSSHEGAPLCAESAAEGSRAADGDGGQSDEASNTNDADKQAAGATEAEDTEADDDDDAEGEDSDDDGGEHDWFDVGDDGDMRHDDDHSTADEERSSSSSMRAASSDSDGENYYDRDGAVRGLSSMSGNLADLLAMANEVMAEAGPEYQQQQEESEQTP